MTTSRVKISCINWLPEWRPAVWEKPSRKPNEKITTKTLTTNMILESGEGGSTTLRSMAPLLLPLKSVTSKLILYTKKCPCIKELGKRLCGPIICTICILAAINKSLALLNSLQMRRTLTRRLLLPWSNLQRIWELMTQTAVWFSSSVRLLWNSS